MADDPKPASAADLAELAARVKTLEAEAAKRADLNLAGRVKDLERAQAAENSAPAAAFPWRHRTQPKQRVRIIEQGAETAFESVGGEKRWLPTHEFNAQFEDATLAD